MTVGHAARGSLLAGLIWCAVLAASDAAAQTGSWTAPTEWPAPASDVVAIHMALLPTGKVLFFESRHSGNLANQTSTYLFDPGDGTVTQTGTAPANMFCAGHSSMADGRVFVIGGTLDTPSCGNTTATEIFNHSTGTWTARDAMEVKRWYGTATTLGDGRVLATSGVGGMGDTNDLPEIYTPAINLWRTLPCTEPPAPCPAKKHLPLYPFIFLLPDGRLFAAGAPVSTAVTPLTTWTLDLPTNTWAAADSSDEDGGSAVMYLPGKVMKSGGGRDPEHSPAAATTEVIDMTVVTPEWRQPPSGSMNHGRFYHTNVLLPDGTVLAVGGSTQGCSAWSPITVAELWNPTTKVWTDMASQTEGRMYHSTALLLPDGRVISAGGGGTGARLPCGSYAATNYEIFSPPYLSAGTPATVSGSTPTSMTYDKRFLVTMSKPAGTTVRSVALLRPGTVTHGFDMNQRYVPLTIVDQTNTRVTVRTPANGNTAPPGQYMLFLVLNTGRPSVAYWVTLG